jgi:hypothetical protein
MKPVIVGMIARDTVDEDAKKFMALHPGTVWATWDDWYTETYVFAMSENPFLVQDDADFRKVVVACGEMGAGAKTWEEYFDMIQCDDALLSVMKQYPSLTAYLRDEQIFDFDDEIVIDEPKISFNKVADALGSRVKRGT